MATIAENLSRIQSAKADIKTAIEAKGVTVPSSATIDTYATYVSQISGGGGGIPIPSNLSAATLNDYGLLTSAAIKSGVTSIGETAFKYCSSLTSVTIPDSVTSIGSEAFSYCSGLTSVTIPDSVTSIGDDAFYYCSSLTSVSIGNSVTSIGGNAFASCTSLTSVTIPDSVTSIGINAFRYCRRLTSIDIGSGVTSIVNYAFNGCRSLTSVTVNALTPPKLGTSVFTNTNDCPIYVPAQSVDAYKSATNWSTYASRIQAIPT